MPALHPPTHTFSADTGAEKVVWDALVSQLPDDAHLLHGQRITAYDPGLAGQLLYVGMSRAQSLLVVVGPREEIEAAAGVKVMALLDAGLAWCPPGA